MFRSLAGINYRLWFAGALVSNIGTWMQRTAQDWVVLTELTDHDAAAVGIVMALQLGPQLLLVPWSGLIADRFDKRRILIGTQAVMAGLGIGLGVLVVSGAATLPLVYVFALALGITGAIDAPARQAFVSELVSEKDLPNAVALNSASFNGARLIGPAVAGVLTVVVGAGWVFVINGFTFAATLLSLILLRRDKLRPAPRAPRGPGQLLEGLRYVRTRPDILVIMLIVFIIGTFGLNFPIFVATMSTVEFDHGAGEYGLLSSILAIGSVTGALLAARREKPRLGVIFIAAGAFGASCVLAAIAPTYVTFALALVLVGFTSITLLTTANATVQTTTAPAMRGRVMAIYFAIFMGGTPLGAPLVGLVANLAGPRWALGVGAASGLVAALIGVVFLARRGELPFFSRASAEHPAVELETELEADESAARRT